MHWIFDTFEIHLYILFAMDILLGPGNHDYHNNRAKTANNFEFRSTLHPSLSLFLNNLAATEALRNLRSDLTPHQRGCYVREVPWEGARAPLATSCFSTPAFWSNLLQSGYTRRMHQCSTALLQLVCDTRLCKSAAEQLLWQWVGGSYRSTESDSNQNQSLFVCPSLHAFLFLKVSLSLTYTHTHIHT